jgi:uncharacterized protein
MSNRVSSFPAKPTWARDTRPWYREPWPWLLTAGPLVVVIASLTSAWIAVKSDDGVLAQDYYKQGLRINETLKRLGPDPERRLGATITVAAGGEVRAHVEGLATAPQSLRLTLARPVTGGQPEVVTLAQGADGDYTGALREQVQGRWILTLQSADWQLPTTTGVGRLSQVRLGTAEHS